MMLADSGVMMLTWNGWLVETTFWTGVGFVLLTLFTVLVMVQLWRGFAPNRLWLRFRERRNQKTAKKDTAQAIHAWLAGQDDKAIASLKRVAESGGSDRLPRAMTLALGWHQADWLERQAELLQLDPELKPFAYAIGAQRLWSANQTDQFVVHMNQHAELKQIPWLRNNYWQSLLDQGQGEQVLELTMVAATIQPDERSRWVLMSAISALNAQHRQLEKGQQLIKKIPKSIKNHADYLHSEISFWLSVNEPETAFKKMVLGFKLGHGAALVELLSMIPNDANKKLELLEQYEPSEPSAHYSRAMGEVNLELQLWGQAQSWLEKGWAQNDLRCARLLAQLFEQRNMADQANKLYKTIAQLSTQ
jgi:hypothetical protein